MIMPRHLTATATTVKGLLNNCSTWFTQSLLAEFLCTDAFGRHLRRIRTIYALRRNCLVNALEHHFKGSDISGAQAGMHLVRSEGHTSELQSLMRISYAVFCFKKK